MASEVKSITSESLEAAYRALTPSQSGFTQDLMASNTIIPVLDLTASASGSSTPQNMQTALAFGSQTAFDVTNTTTTIINTPGFYRIIGTFTGRGNSTTANTRGYIQMSDGLSTKVVYGTETGNSAVNGDLISTFDITVFVASGITTNILCGDVMRAVGSTRQIADVNGVLVNPAGFTPQ
tara:strand:+ start:220 stop:759 length:540 start_codon:yes stop_codon:yes gene_type:complete